MLKFLKKQSTIYNLQSIPEGFTLIELLVIIAVIGVLATALVTIINPLEQFSRTRDSQRKSDLAHIQRALEQYYNDHNSYPESSGGPNYYMQDIVGHTLYSWGGSNFAPYLNVVPIDPVSSQKYIYVSTPPDKYTIYAHLERGNRDSQVCNPADDSKCSNVPANVYCGTGTEVCDYGVSSPNTSP